MDARRFALKLASLAPIAIVVALVNYVADPAEVFHAGNYERQVARLMLDGWNVSNYSAPDERLTEKFYIAGMRRPHDIAVFGSSRMLQLTADDIGASCFNHALSGATVRDWIAIYGMLRRQQVLPSTLVLGLDPWTLSTGPSDDVRWHSLWREYADLASTMRLPDADVGRPWPTAEFRELFSLSYFQLSLPVLRDWPPARYRPLTGTRDQYGDRPVKRHDGSIGYDAGTRQRDAAAVDAAAADFVRNSDYAMRAFAAIDGGTADALKALVRLMRRDGVTVVLWQSPVHPLVYTSFAADPVKRRGIEEFERYTTELARMASAPVVGSFNPSDLGWRAADFYDGVHPTAHAIAPLTRQLVAASAPVRQSAVQ